MILGEGSVFLIILSLGIIFISRARRNEKSYKKREENLMLGMTHELKTPIASTRLSFETLKNPNLSESQKENIISRGIESMDRLNLLVDNVLHASNIDNQSNQTTKVELSNVLKHIVISTDNERITLHNQESLQINFNLSHLEIIISNLLQNALKYSDGDITIDCSRNELRIGDQGHGIPQVEREKIFEKFYRIGDESTRKTSGSGLGLYLANELAKLNNAQIIYEENKPQGSIFILRFVE